MPSVPGQIRLGRLYRTVRHLRPIQISNRILRLRRPHPRRVVYNLRPRNAPLVPLPDFTPRALVRESRLRTYTLHYQHRPVLGDCLRWILENPPAGGPGWEPYPIARRILNWIKAFEEPPSAVAESLATQADYLQRTLEYHLLGNHLFVNAVALTAAGCFFKNNRWLQQGVSLLEQEIREQILADGGHYERSPMYQGLVIEDLLDLMNLRQAYGALIPDWSNVISGMLSWHRQMTHPDGEISFFNDATFGVAPAFAELQAYALRLGIEPASLPLKQSGYIRLTGPATVLLFDAGRISPDYQPGHAHAETLSFELSHAGKRVLVNSGISTYESGAERKQQRGTAAHNCLSVDGRDSSEVWASFRVGARAQPLEVKSDHNSWAEASHDGYGACIHKRRVEVHADKVTIVDSLRGPGKHRLELFFHLHPGANTDSVVLDPRLRREIKQTEYHPFFDVDVSKQTVRGVADLDTSHEITLTTRVDLGLSNQAGEFQRYSSESSEQLCCKRSAKLL